MTSGSTIELLTTDVTARTQWRVVRIVLPDGRHGIGEASDSGPLSDAVDVLAALEPGLSSVIEDVAVGPDAVRAWADDAVASVDDSRFARAVVGGVEQALCDLHAAAAHQPVSRWLSADAAGRNLTDGVACYANVNRVPGGRTPADVAAAAQAAVAAGFRTVKCAPFDAEDGDQPLSETGLRRLEAVRDAVGAQVEVLVDCHFRLSLDQVLDIVPALTDLDVGWVEDAVATSDLVGLRRLREHSALRLAGGEFSYSAEQFVPAIEAQLLDVLLLDVKHAGGITRALQLADQARAAGDVAISPHNPTGPVGTAASAQFLLATSGAEMLELAVGEVGWRPDTVRPRETVTGGRLTVGEAPGLGVVLSDRQSGVSTAWSSRAEVTS